MRERVAEGWCALDRREGELADELKKSAPTNLKLLGWVKPEEFVALADYATEIGFAGVMSGPLVRSSYRAGRLYQQAISARNGTTV